MKMCVFASVTPRPGPPGLWRAARNEKFVVGSNHALSASLICQTFAITLSAPRWVDYDRLACVPAPNQDLAIGRCDDAGGGAARPGAELGVEKPNVRRTAPVVGSISEMPAGLLAEVPMCGIASQNVRVLASLVDASIALPATGAPFVWSNTVLAITIGIPRLIFNGVANGLVAALFATGRYCMFGS